MPLAILYRQELKEYDFGPGHPFRGDRYELFPQFLKENLSQDGNYRILESDWAGDDDLALICQPDYIHFTAQFFRSANLGLTYNGDFYRYHSGDNHPMGRCGKLEEAARLIVGQAKLAADLLQSGDFEKAVCIGGGMHHAKPGYGEGFCIYNDVAFAAMYAIQKHGLERVLVLDTDAHAGNGTSEYFYSNPKVLFVDLHQDPRTLYPGTGYASDIGAGEGKGFTVNIPMPMSAGFDSYQLAFDEIIHPLTEEFKPQIIIRNGGSDPHFADSLTQLGLPVKGFRMIGERVRGMATTCQGKVIDLIGSGYNKEVLPYAWLALIAGLGDLPVRPDDPEPIPQRFRSDPSLDETRKVVAGVKRNLADYWECLRGPS